jgi:hypothetical protein
MAISYWQLDLVFILRCHRLDKDNEIQLKKQIQLKEANETQKKDIKVYEEKCRQFQLKLNKLNKTIKDDQEEVSKQFFF